MATFASTKATVKRHSSLYQLRRQAISHSLFPPTTLKDAIERLGFVQADPIRAPARAQDLILRHRVTSYRAGDLERLYASLEIEEDYLYAYGFLPRTIWRLIHPREAKRLSALERKVLNAVSRFGAMHPRELERHFGKARVINAWGGYSKATTQALDQLQFRGLLRIARRENGIRIYEPALPAIDEEPAVERMRKLLLTVVNVLAPIRETTLHANIARYRRLGKPREVLNEMLRAGELEKQTVDGVPYIWPVANSPHADEPVSVHFLAPFDPLVWDRRRFEHFWQWPYRFEAYTPPAKRLRGYYAMPLLWRDQMIGWANANVSGGHLSVDVGFAQTRPREKDFRRELDAEIARLDAFLTESPREALTPS